MTIPYSLLDAMTSSPMPRPSLIPLQNPALAGLMAPVPDSAAPPMPVGPLPGTSPMLGAPMASAGPTGPAAGPQPSLLDKVRSGAASLLASAEDSLFPIPAGLRGILPGSDLEGAQHQAMLDLGMSLLQHSRGAPGQNAPSFDTGLAAAVQDARGAYPEHLQTRMNSLTQGLQTAQTARMLQGRADIAQRFAPKDGETPRETLDRLRSMYAAFALTGDTQMLNALNPEIAALGQDPEIQHQQYAKPADQVDLGDRVLLLDPVTHAPMSMLPKGAPPVSDKELAAMGLTRENTMFQRTQTVVDRFNKETADAHVVADYANSIKASVPAALQNDHAAQVALIANYVKLVNPQARSASGAELTDLSDAGGVADWVMKLVDKVIGHGANLSPAEVSEIANSAEQVAQQWDTRTKSLLNKYKGYMERVGGDPSALVDPFFDLKKKSGASMQDLLKGGGPF